MYHTLHSVIRGENIQLITYVSAFYQLGMMQVWINNIYIYIHLYFKFQSFCSYLGSQQAFEMFLSFSIGKSNPISQEVWMVHGLKVHFRVQEVKF